MEKITPFEWYRLWIAYETPWTFLGEVVFRTVVMFIFLLVILKLLSKRGVKQLSVFELAILIALGSASGDPMFYYNIPLLSGMLVLVLVVLIYRIVTHLSYKNTQVEMLLEGKPVCLLKDGRIDYANYRKVKLAQDKFFAELRINRVDHLGQVRRVYLETSGEMSVYLRKDEEVEPGLPIYPEMIEQPLETIGEPGAYACTQCGQVETQAKAARPVCPVCEHRKWLPAWDMPRIE